MKRWFFLLALIGAISPGALAQDKPGVPAERVTRAVKDAFRSAPTEWHARLEPDQTMKECAASENSPPQAVFDKIRERERATIRYPEDGKLLGDWKSGEKIAQSGYGLRFSDYPPRGPNGGNCYACHQLTKQEVSFGTIGPSLLGYGKAREFSAEAIKAAYEKIYNAHATFACSLMPRFGTNGILTMDQMKDLVALLMDRESPVNKE